MQDLDAVSDLRLSTVLFRQGGESVAIPEVDNLLIGS